MFFEEFKVRWSDIDANRHLGNSSYFNFCSQTRMSFLNQHKIGIIQLVKWNIGPVVLSEQIFYFKEILPDQTIYVSLELDGISKDGTIFSSIHKFYDASGIHYATAKVFGVWIDLKLRKKTIPPTELIDALQEGVEAFSPKELTDLDIKNSPYKPENISSINYKND